MFDLHLCLSASVNVRPILHTQPLGLYNEILTWVSLYPSLSLYLSLLDYPSHLLHLLLPLHTILSPPLAFPFSISSTLTLPMTKNGNYNSNGHGNNNARNDASKALDERTKEQHETPRAQATNFE
jgi:hypothetical protein